VIRTTSRRGLPVTIFDNYWATTLAFARSLGGKGVPLHFYGRGAGQWSRYRSQRFKCPPVENADEFRPWLREQVRSGAITRIAPTTDLIAFYTSALRAEFSPEVQRTIAPLQEIENCLIKTRFSTASGMPGHAELPTAAPDSLEGARTAAAELGYPLILKPKSHLAVGFEERGRLLLNEKDLDRHYRRYDVAPGQQCIADAYPELRWPLLQRYVPSARNRVYSISGIKDADGGIVTASVSFKREQWPPDVGVSLVQIAHEDARILEFGLLIVNRVLSRGIFEVELVADGDALYPIDLNPRSFGFIELDMARGANLPWLWFCSTLEPLQPQSKPILTAQIEARHRFMYLLRAIAHPHLINRTPSMERRDGSRRRASVSMLGHWSDPLPMIISNLKLLRHPRSLLRSVTALS
jgi:predicted ATP-grasp superfamily ATP-dependent carboligase